MDALGGGTRCPKRVATQPRRNQGVKDKTLHPMNDPSVPPEVLAEWWMPFSDYLEKERRYSRYTVRNYRQAFEDFHRWLVEAGRWDG